MAAISLVDAATYTKGLPHQLEAWQWLQQQLSDEQLAAFAERFRRQPPPPPPREPRGTSVRLEERGVVKCHSIFARSKGSRVPPPTERLASRDRTSP